MVRTLRGRLPCLQPRYFIGRSCVLVGGDLPPPSCSRFEQFQAENPTERRPPVLPVHRPPFSVSPRRARALSVRPLFHWSDESHLPGGQHLRLHLPAALSSVRLRLRSDPDARARPNAHGGRIGEDSKITPLAPVPESQNP